ncbi:hypothetical protein [Bacillus sp. FJAT-49736]|uniref:WD40/YVTN/BNR-like repeat-containing protein n=1 Tax=Bacillus sp. FJAT-49736 TaxID=2833582 RepID=UPI001BC8E00C|nr:hypothetical protein [Bacillus sp. FJAT-49736]MBS4174368.1 hypothetical protein [Bacillus sp. FJAT-49736]
MYKLKKRSIILALGLGFSLVLTGCGSEGEQNPKKTSDVTIADKGKTKEQSSNTKQELGKKESSEAGKVADSQNNTGKVNSNSSSTSMVPTKTSNKKVNMSAVTAVRIADPQIGWVGGNGWIAQTTNGGKAWAVVYQGYGTVQQIFALNQQNVWATLNQGGNSLRLLQSRDGGQHWTLIGTTPNQGFLHFVTETAALSGNAYSLDGGRTWHPISTPRNIVGQAYFHDLKNGWAVTQSKKVLYVQKTIDGGKNWSPVLTKKLASPMTNAVIRSAGTKDAWIECIGGSGMTQTSYSVFHTLDGGKSWKTVIANSTAGGGPAPGFSNNTTNGPKNKGSKPGPLYVVSPRVAFLGGACPACDNPNTIGWTKDGGKTWVNGDAAFKGYGDAYLAIADEHNGWWITTENTKPSILYTTSNGGTTWTHVHTFK